MKQQCVLVAALLMVSTMASPCETDHDCSGTYFCNCNYVCDMCDEHGMNCAAEAKSGRPSECTDNPGMDSGSDNAQPSPSPTGMFDGSDPDTPRDPGCCMASDWSVSDATKCINAYKVSYCNNEPGWENCEWIYDDDHVDQADCENPDADESEEEDCVCTKEFMPYCCDGVKYDNECMGLCAGAVECLGMKHPDQTCTEEECTKMCMDGFECVFDDDMEMACQKVDGGDDDDEDAGCCYASDPNHRMASNCYDIDASACANGARMGCAWMSGDDADCSVPAPEPGCCFGSNNACDTDDETMCGKAKRKGCEWRSGADADCEPVPGCCSGTDAMCFDYDEATCAKNMRKKGCEWITGTTECVPPTPEPGCCYGSDSMCDTDDAAVCGGRSAMRSGCEWRSGHDADCTPPEPEEGCCAGETERKTSMCGKSPSSMNCGNMNGCYWVDGHDADCSWADSADDHGAMCCGDSSSKMSMCSNSMSMNNCDGMNGCHWVTMASDCAMEEQMFFAGHGIEEAMDSQVSLSTLLLSMVCLVALWKAYGWWSSRGGYAKVKQSVQVDGQGYYQSA